MGRILFIITGGTIDSCNGLVCGKESNIPNFIKEEDIDADFKIVCMKDSRNITQHDLDKILKIIEESEHDEVIITHGTYTIAKTGSFLKQRLGSDKTAVLTGSFQPLVNENSDAPKNLRYSISKVKSLNPGVYICIDNHVFDPEHTKKDTKESRFVKF